MKEIKVNKRYITSVVYVAVLLLLLTLKWLVSPYGALGFDALFCAISVIGCIEFFNAVKVVPFAQRVVSIAFCSAVVPLFVLCEFMQMGGYIPVAILFIVFVLALVIIGIFGVNESTLVSTLLSIGALAYCGILSCVFAAVNHLDENSAPLVLLMFLIVMLTDSFAYAVGKLFKRWLPYKLAPKVSPNKTIIGGVGGIIGGMAAGVAAYYIWFGLSKVAGEALVYTGSIPGAVAFMLVGLVGAIIGQAGDLFESYIKRRCDIKDSGNILPGHGGILDRFDSMLFVGVLVLVSSFLLVL